MSKHLRKNKYWKRLRIVDVMCFMKTRHCILSVGVQYLLELVLQLKIEFSVLVVFTVMLKEWWQQCFWNQSMFLNYLAVSSYCTACTLTTLILGYECVLENNLYLHVLRRISVYYLLITLIELFWTKRCVTILTFSTFP